MKDITRESRHKAGWLEAGWRESRSRQHQVFYAAVLKVIRQDQFNPPHPGSQALHLAASFFILQNTKFTI